jgi:hypothetical protein
MENKFNKTMFFIFKIFIVFTLLFSLYSVFTSADSFVLRDSVTTASNIYDWGDTSILTYFYSTFIASSNYNLSILSIEHGFYDSSNSCAGNGRLITAYIYNTSSNKPDTLLATSLNTINTSQIGLVFYYFNYTFNNYSLISGNQYAIVMHLDSNCAGKSVGNRHTSSTQYWGAGSTASGEEQTYAGQTNFMTWEYVKTLLIPPDLYNPLCSDVITLNPLAPTLINFSFNETSLFDYVNISYDDNITIINNITSLFYLWYITTNNISTGNHTYYVNVCYNNGCSINNSCLNICVNNYERYNENCVNNFKLINYYDANNCPIEYDFPTTNGTYENCTTPPTTINNNISLDPTLISLILFIIVLYLSFSFAYNSEGKLKATYIFFGIMLYFFNLFLQTTIFLNVTGAYQLESIIIDSILWTSTIGFILFGIYNLFKK